MTYLALTLGTADWLQGKAGVISALNELILADGPSFRPLQNTEFVEGPVRLAMSAGQEIIAIWNTDYLNGTGEESWGFVRLDREGGLLSQRDISLEVLERCVYVINQRLQGLLIDGAYIHRSFDNGAHSCLAGRGTRARHFSVGYFERASSPKGTQRKAILCVGPIYDPTFAQISQLASKEARKLTSLLPLANNLVSGSASRVVATSEVYPVLREHLHSFGPTPKGGEYSAVEFTTHNDSLSQSDLHRVQGLSYEEWIASNSPLTASQRAILESGALDRHPLRIVGPGGSGKTLLMQLLAVRQLRLVRDRGASGRILYVVHNAAMQQKVQQRFELLLGTPLAAFGEDQRIDVNTLSEYGRTQLGLDFTSVIDSDAQQAKQFQLEEVSRAMQESFEENEVIVRGSKLLSEVKTRPDLHHVFAFLLMVEISSAIKGHGLEGYRKRYVESERKLSRLHGILTPKEREFVFDIFTRYHKHVFELHQVLDTDDIAVSLLARLRTPLWELKRKTLGYDYIFVDETQLFNENEKRILPLLTKGTTSYVPIALALDEAQQLYGQRSAGLATIGIKDIANESLPSIYRSTRSIVKLAFFIIQRCTDLFDADFPDFTRIADEMAPDSHPLAAPPLVIANRNSSLQLPSFVFDQVQKLRSANIRQVAVICHADQYWESLMARFRDSTLPLYILEQRGEKLPADQPAVVLSRPAHVGGQEFDAVILVGLEQGVVPPKIAGNEALSSAVEQQALREMYLSITRTRYQLIVALSYRASCTPVLQDAITSGLIRAG